METGTIVEFIDSQKIVCAVALEVKNLRLRLLTENNREVKLSIGRLSHSSSMHLDLSMGRDRLVTTLKSVALHRNSLIDQIDIQELWEVLNSEQEWIDLATMTAFCFPENATADHESAVIRAFFKNRLYFRFGIDRFFPNSQEKVEQLIAQQEAADRREKLIHESALWLKKTLARGNGAVPDNHSEIIEILKSYYLYEKESPHSTDAQAILSRAGIDSIQQLFTFLVRLGIWGENENLDLLRFEIPVEFPPQVLHATAELATQSKTFPTPGPEGRRDLTSLPTITIDGQSTLDFDDALSIEACGDHLRLGIHIADVGAYIKKNDPIDQEACQRGSSIYMPDRKISMVPACLADELCSLRQGQVRPAISTMVRITPQAHILDFEIFASTIRVDRQLTYYDANLIAEQDQQLAAMYEIARNFRKMRLAEGAIQITLPEINIWLNGNAQPTFTRVNRESPARMLVSELMILANWLTARFLAQHQMPAVFRTQPGPKERLFNGDEGSLFQNWMQRKLLSRFVLSHRPENHHGLGLDAYVTATSPIRKYFDLITQRQVRALLGLETPYSKSEINSLIQALQRPMSLVAKLQYRRLRYWLLKYMQGCTGQKEEAIVLNRRRNGYAVLLKEYLLECHLPFSNSLSLRPEDLIQVTLQHIDARRDVVTVFMG